MKEKKITVDTKLNHRYLDINMRMPKKLSVFEAAIRTLLKEYIQRERWICSLPMRIIPRVEFL